MCALSSKPINYLVTLTPLDLSSHGIDPLCSIFELEKLRESLASSYPLKTLQRNRQKVVRKAPFWPAFDCFSTREASPSVGSVRNRFYATDYIGCDWNLEIFFSVPNREKSTGVTWTKLLASKSIVRWSGRIQVSSLGIDPPSAIFQSK